MRSLDSPHASFNILDIPAWIVGLVLSNWFRPAISFAGVMVAFFATLLATHLFSLCELFTSLEGVLMLSAQILAGLIVMGAITLPERKGR